MRSRRVVLERIAARGPSGVIVRPSTFLTPNGTPVKIINAAAIDREWFWSYVEKIPFHTCWEWTGTRDEAGYGTYHQNYGRARAQRVAWALTHGDVPADLLVCHKCDNPSCVWPDHLFLGTEKDNSADKASKGRAWSPLAQREAAQTHCKRGHPLAGANLRLKPRSNGRSARECRACMRDCQAQWYARKSVPRD